MRSFIISAFLSAQVIATPLQAQQKAVTPKTHPIMLLYNFRIENKNSNDDLKFEVNRLDFANARDCHAGAQKSFSQYVEKEAENDPSAVRGNYFCFNNKSGAIVGLGMATGHFFEKPAGPDTPASSGFLLPLDNLQALGFKPGTP